MNYPSCFDALPRRSGGLPQRRAIAIHRLAPIEKPRLLELPHNYLPFGKCTANSPPHTRALMILFCSSHAKLSSDIEIIHVTSACGSPECSNFACPFAAGGLRLAPRSFCLQHSSGFPTDDDTAGAYQTTLPQLHRNRSQYTTQHHWDQ